MSFRVEKKLFINPKNLFDFKKFLDENEIIKLHNTRFVKSLYFENNKNQMFLDSIEGILPRKKIRIRTYPKSNNLYYYLEYKYSSIEGRYKENYKITEDKKNFYLSNGIFDKKYGLCKPKLEVIYKREYYFKNDVRVTIDTDICYNFFLKKKIVKDKNTAVELKTKISKDLDELFENFPFQEIRFSKYCNGLNLLNKI